MRRAVQKGLSGRKAALIAYFAANPELQLCDQCVRKELKCQRSMLTEKDIRESALGAGLVRKQDLCAGCHQVYFLTATH